MLYVYVILLLLGGGALSLATHYLQVEIVPSQSQHFEINDSNILAAISVHLRTSLLVSAYPLDVNAGNNGGVWTLNDRTHGATSYVAKWRPTSNLEDTQEVDLLVSLFQRHPNLWSDPDVVAPHVILDIRNLHGYRSGYLIIAKKTDGNPLTAYIFQAATRGDSEAARIVISAGRDIAHKLCKFHKRYGEQHGDLHSSNIIVDNLGSVRFIDLATLGTSLVFDLTYLTNSLKQLERAYNYSPLPNWSLLYRVLSESYVC